MYQFISSFFQIISLIRFSLLLLVLGVAVLWVEQWLEALRYLSMHGSSQYGQALSLGLATFIASLSTWYSAHVMFMLYIPHIEVTDPDSCPKVKKYLSKTLGLLMNLLVMLAIMKANDWKSSTWVSTVMIFQYLALFLYTIIILFRKKLLSKEHQQDMLGQAEGFRKLPSMTLKVVGLALLVNFFMMILVTITPWLVAKAGTAAIVLMAVGLMAPVGSLLTYLGSSRKFPVLTLLFIWVALVGLVNDNHLVRLHADMSSTSVSAAVENLEGQNKKLSGFETYLKQWIEQRKITGQPVPLVLVSAEGGGIRAAYWTAMVLAGIEDDESSDFSRYVFAISGVSGGSLGATVYASLLKHNLDNENSEHFKSKLSASVNGVLSEDFLSPTAATMLFPDLLQRFLPWPIFDDRAITLERTWERAWGKWFGETKNYFAQQYFDLYQDGETRVPLLFLNSTVVETGRRMLLSPLTYEEESVHDKEATFNSIFNETINARPIVGEHIPLSTAVHLSARFTYISPAGKLYCDDFSGKDGLYCGFPKKMRTIRLVDGGYFENSATVTASEILHQIQKYNTEHCSGKPCVEPLILHISNESEKLSKEELSNQLVLLSEILSPLRALLNVRPARGFQSRAALENENSDDFYHVGIKQSTVKLPLGWMLSEIARDEMDGQVNKHLNAPCVVNENKDKESDGRKNKVDKTVCDLLRRLDYPAEKIDTVPVKSLK